MGIGPGLLRSALKTLTQGPAGAQCSVVPAGRTAWDTGPKASCSQLKVGNRVGERCSLGIGQSFEDIRV